MAVQIAKAVGARVIAVVSGSQKAKVLFDIGADAVVDHHEAKWEDKVKAHTANDEGVDVVYDSIGAIESGIRCLKYRRRLVIVGFAARGGKIEEVRANRILLKGITVVGYVSFLLFSSCLLLFLISSVLNSIMRLLTFTFLHFTEVR
jgi:transcription elongation factor SPT5